MQNQPAPAVPPGRRERSCGAFARTLNLPFEIDPDSVVATFSNGILTVSLPKPVSVTRKPEEIAINC
ncbi:MAG TPA: Hsp20/alpha crystallin family protein [Devosiaceae bacterium]|nr:Hsp20/alpha crystallin family protein [Devosiaceae bacterium]